MADLIIKPSVGNLILKDDQNVTRVSIAPTTGVTTLSNQVFPSSQVFPAGTPTGYTAFNITSGTSATTSTSTPSFFGTTGAISLATTDVLVVHYQGGRTGQSTSQRSQIIIKITDGSTTEQLVGGSHAYADATAETNNSGFVVSGTGYSGTTTVSIGTVSLDGSNTSKWIASAGVTIATTAPCIRVLLQKMKG